MPSSVTGDMVAGLRETAYAVKAAIVGLTKSLAGRVRAVRYSCECHFALVMGER